MKISDAFPSNYVKAADIKGTRPTLVVSSVLTEAMPGDGDEHKPVMYFDGAKKGLVLNWTNATTIAEAFGDETDAWVGQKITLYTMKVQSPRGGMVDGIRVEPVLNGPPQKGSVGHREEANQMAHESAGDDIPF